jgi:hypothetical protein
MNVKRIRKVVFIAIAYCAVSLGAMLYQSISAARSSAEERRIANQSWEVISESLSSFLDAKGCYPATLDELSLNKDVALNFRYWTNGNGGYSLVWEGKHGFRSIASTGTSNTPSKRPDRKESKASTNDLDSAAILNIARHAVSTNDTWINKAKFENPKQRADGSWTVMVWERPYTFGGHRLIKISEDGRVISYSRGK